MGPLSKLLNPTVLGSPVNTGNVKQSHNITQQYPIALATAGGQDPPAFPGLTPIPPRSSERFAR